MNHSPEQPSVRALVFIISFLAACGLFALYGGSAMSAPKKCVTVEADMADTKSTADKRKCKWWATNRKTKNGSVTFGYIVGSKAGFVVAFVGDCAVKSFHIPVVVVRKNMGEAAWADLHGVDA